MENKDEWIVYLLRCADDTLYCGITNDLQRRVRAHNAGAAAKYTRGRRPVIVVAQRNGLTKSEALRLEAQVKRRSRENKKEFLNKNSKT